MENDHLKISEIERILKDHYNGKMVAWKIRRGIKSKISETRIKNYVEWYYTSFLVTHFEFEELAVFALLGDKNIHFKKIISQHKKLKKLILSKTHIQNNLSLLEEELEVNIRYEEKIINDYLLVKLDEPNVDILDELKFKITTSDSTFKSTYHDQFWN